MAEHDGEHGAEAEPARGLVLIFTGRGKGKTTAALGSALRAVGHGQRVLMIQFIKGARDTGESAAAAHLPGLELRPLGRGLPGRSRDLAPHREAARLAWETVRAEMAAGRWELLILDEVFAALNRGFVTVEELAGLLTGRPPGVNLILTGRGCPPELYPRADCVR